MTKVRASDARARLSSLLDQVAKGEEFVITRFGRPVARLTPLRDVSLERRRQAIQRLEAFSKGQTLGDLTVRELRDHGRRF
jgi:prevent-host-death family protein